LHYTPTNTNKKAFKIPLSTPEKSPTSYTEHKEQKTNHKKIKRDDKQLIMKSRNSSIDQF